MRFLVSLGVVLGLVGAAYILTSTTQVTKTDSVLTMYVPQTTQQAQQLELPFTPADTDLVIEELTTYEGPFLEDGSNGEVSDVAALVVYNPLETAMEQANITVSTQTELLQFEGWFLPPKSRCVLLETNKKQYHYEPILDCAGRQKLSEAVNLLGSTLVLREDTQDILSLENQSEKETGEIQLYYKTYLQQTDTYIGGITRQLQSDSILPGQSRQFSPPYYVRGYVKVFLVAETGK